MVKHQYRRASSGINAENTAPVLEFYLFLRAYYRAGNNSLTARFAPTGGGLRRRFVGG